MAKRCFEPRQTGCRTLNILVVASGFSAQYRVLRCAAALGHRVFVAGEGVASLLATSRCCTRYFNLSLDAKGLPDVLNAIISKHGISFVIPSDATTTRLLGAVGHKLDAKTFPVPDPAAFDVLNDKSRFMDLCSRLDIPHPRSWRIARRADLAEVFRSGKLKGRAVVKPLDRSGGIGFRTFEEHQLAEVTALLEYEPFLLQEFVDGEDISTGLFCRKGEAIAAVTYRRRSGAIEYFENPELMQYALKIAKYFSFQGVINLDARVGADGSLRLIECNPRFFFPLDVTMVAGVNFVEFGLNEAVATATPLVTTSKRVRMIKASLSKLMSLRGIQKQDWSFLFYTLSDPVPTLLGWTGYRTKWSFPMIDAVLRRVTNLNASWRKASS